MPTQEGNASLEKCEARALRCAALACPSEKTSDERPRSDGCIRFTPGSADSSKISFGFNLGPIYHPEWTFSWPKEPEQAPELGTEKVNTAFAALSVGSQFVRLQQSRHLVIRKRRSVTSERQLSFLVKKTRSRFSQCLARDGRPRDRAAELESQEAPAELLVAKVSPYLAIPPQRKHLWVPYRKCALYKIVGGRAIRPPTLPHPQPILSPCLPFAVKSKLSGLLVRYPAHL